MRKLFKTAAGALLLALLLSGNAGAARTEFLIPGGETIGLKLELGGVSVVEFAESSPAAKNAGLKKGDLICKIDGVRVVSSEQLAQRVAQSQGRELAVTVRRGEAEKRCVLRRSARKTAGGWAFTSATASTESAPSPIMNRLRVPSARWGTVSETQTRLRRRAAPLQRRLCLSIRAEPVSRAHFRALPRRRLSAGLTAIPSAAYSARLPCRKSRPCRSHMRMRCTPARLAYIPV